MTEIFIVNVREPIKDSCFNFLMQFVGSEKRERIVRRKIKQDADNMLVGEILAKTAIKKAFGISIENQEFVCDKNQKPYLAAYPNIFFNISHSGGLVACAVSDKAVGLDIQRIGSYRAKTAERVCNYSELEQIEKSGDRASEFTKIWTQKEAALKKNGVGLAAAAADIKNCTAGVRLRSEKIGEYWLSYTE